MNAVKHSPSVVCVQLLQKSWFSCWFLLQFCASLVLLVQSVRVNSIKQTSRNNSLSLLVPLPIAPSPTYQPVFPPISVSFCQFFYFSTYQHSVSPPPRLHLSALHFSLAYSLSILSSFHIPLLSPPTFPSPSDVLLGRLTLCVVVMKRTKGQEWAQHL